MGGPRPNFHRVSDYGAPPEHHAGRARGRRRRRSAVLALAALTLVAGGVIGVVAALGALDGRGPLIERCSARLTEATAPTLTPAQSDNAALFGAIATHRGLPARAVTIAIATSMQESKLRNLDYGDRDSLGLFQQRPSQGWGTAEQVLDPVYATNAFYDVLVAIAGYEDLPVTDAAQRVQHSAFPGAYADHEETARAFASALTGYSPAALTCLLEDASDAERAAAAATVTARLTRDFVALTPQALPDGAVQVDAAELAPGASEDERIRLGWAVAQWAVATASETGASTVSTNGMAWNRADGASATWEPIVGDAEPLGPGLVVIG